MGLAELNHRRFVSRHALLWLGPVDRPWRSTVTWGPPRNVGMRAIQGFGDKRKDELWLGSLIWLCRSLSISADWAWCGIIQVVYLWTDRQVSDLKHAHQFLPVSLSVMVCVTELRANRPLFDIPWAVNKSICRKIRLKKIWHIVLNFDVKRNEDLLN